MYSPLALVVAVATIVPLASSSLTVDPVTYPSTTVPVIVSGSIASSTVMVKDLLVLVVDSLSVAVTIIE